MSKLTVVFPVYNSITRNGDGFIQQALDSLLNQTFEDFEIHILDNISTDDTPKICEKYARSDKRIKFTIDTKRRFPEDGINKIVENVTSEYLMVANCDDLWNYHYMEVLLDTLNKNPKIAGVYSNGHFINVENHIGGSLITNTSFAYTNEVALNFCLAVQHRNVVPAVFSIFRTESYKSALPFTAFDTLKANVDNLFLMKFLLNGNKLQLVNEKLFYYRNKNRKLDPPKIEGMPTSPILIWTYYIIHQLKFYTVVAKCIPSNTPLLNVVAFDSCLRHIRSLLLWVMRDFETDKFERSTLETLYERYKVIESLLLTNPHPKFTEDLCKTTCKKGRIFKKRIVQYVYDIMRPHTILDEMLTKVDTINTEMALIVNNFKS
jgi:glycosyltransferase involved in cell wall biosynthesis